MAPIFTIVGAVLEIPVEVVVTVQQGQLAVFDKALGLGLLVGESQLSGPCGYGQGENAPLHRLHQKCSFGLKVSHRVSRGCLF